MTARKDLGFTLVEVITVVLIIAVIAAIAIPSYQNMMQRARRGEAVTIINEQRLRLEKYRVDHASYGDYWDDATVAKGLTSTPFYEIDVEGDETSYTITATPNDPGPQASDPCETLTLTFADGEIDTDPKEVDGEICW